MKKCFLWWWWSYINVKLTVGWLDTSHFWPCMRFHPWHNVLSSWSHLFSEVHKSSVHQNTPTWCCDQHHLSASTGLLLLNTTKQVIKIPGETGSGPWRHHNSQSLQTKKKQNKNTKYAELDGSSHLLYASCSWMQLGPADDSLASVILNLQLLNLRAASDICIFWGRGHKDTYSEALKDGLNSSKS